MRLKDIQNYQDEYVRITRSCIITPEAFFREIKGEGKRYLKPIAYMLISLAVYVSGSLSVYLFLPNYYFSQAAFFILSFFIWFVLVAIILIILIPFTIRIAGGKAGFNETFKIICYSSSVFNFIWLIFVSFGLLITYGRGAPELIAVILLLLFGLLLLDVSQYILYQMITGISIVSEITKIRAFIAVILSFIILFALITSGSILLHELSYRPISPKPPYNPPNQVINSYNLTVYQSTPPIIDGNISDNDMWSEGTNVQAYVRGKYYTISMKHDREKLYILMHWKGTPDWKNDMISIYFEQDSGKPDSNINTGLLDWYYQSDGTDPARFGDGHYESGYVPDQRQDCSLKVGYDVNRNEWVEEWNIPLNSGDKYDIFVDKYPAVLGFSIINERAGEGGILPSTAYRSDPRTWARLNIVDSRKSQANI